MNHKVVDASPAAGSSDQRYWWLQANQTGAAQVLNMLETSPMPTDGNQTAARVFATAQRSGVRVDAASLRHAAALYTLPMLLPLLSSERPPGSTGPVFDVDTLRQLAAAHHEPTQRSPTRLATQRDGTTLLQIERQRPVPLPAVPPKPAAGEPIKNMAAFVVPSEGRWKLELANADLRSVADAAAQLTELRRSYPSLLIDMSGAQLQGAQLQGADLIGVLLSGANLTGADLRGANLDAAIMRGANLDGANMTATRLTANLEGASLRGTDLSYANLTEAAMTGADLAGATLVGAVMNSVDLRRADLTNANFTQAYMPKAQLAGAFGSDVTLNGASLYRADLSNVYFSGLKMVGAKLVEADLRNATLPGVDLTSGNLANSDLRECNLTGAAVTGAELRGALLEGSQSSGVDWTAALNVDSRAVTASRQLQGAGEPVVGLSAAQGSPVGDADQTIVRDLMARYLTTPQARAPGMERIVWTEIQRSTQAGLQRYRVTGELPAEVRDGGSSQAQFLQRYASPSNYLRHLAQDPARFSAVAQRTVDSEQRYLDLAAESASTGVLGEAQWNAVKDETDPSRRTYLTHRGLSDAIRALDTEWQARASGQTLVPSAGHYGAAMAALSEFSGTPGMRIEDMRIEDRLTHSPERGLADGQPAEWGAPVPVGPHQQDARLSLFARARLLDRVTDIENRISIMGRVGQNDSVYLRTILQGVDASLADMQSNLSSGWAAAPGLNPRQGTEAVRILQTLKAQVETLLQRP